MGRCAGRSFYQHPTQMRSFVLHTLYHPLKVSKDVLCEWCVGDYIEQARKDNAQGIRNVDIFSMVAHAIAETFYDEKCRYDSRFKAGRLSRYDLFEDWCAGLPSILDTCYYYNRSAVDDMGNILEESDTEKAKYTEQQAEKRLTQLIYREIYSVKGV